MAKQAYHVCFVVSLFHYQEQAHHTNRSKESSQINELCCIDKRTFWTISDEVCLLTGRSCQRCKLFRSMTADGENLAKASQNPISDMPYARSTEFGAPYIGLFQHLHNQSLSLLEPKAGRQFQAERGDTGSQGRKKSKEKSTANTANSYRQTPFI